ncbi:MAG: AraC family transcriptional regulator [Alphaproteobacteria bacterium]|nr:AraC family transcriptional regulator [Alphaproteobacteria bacterium]
MQESSLPASGVAWIVRLGVAAGADEGTLLARIGLRAEALSSLDARVPRAQSLALWRAIASHLDDPTLPVRFGQGARPEALGVLGYLMKHANTLGELIHTVERFQRLTQSEAPISVWREPEGISIGQRLFPEEAALRFPQEFVISSFTAMIRAAVGDSWSPVGAFFQHDRVPWASAIRRVFRCPVRFQAPCSGITIHPADMALLLNERDPHLHSYLRQLSLSYLDSMPGRPHWTSTVLRRLARSQLEEMPDLEDVGRALGMSGRTLQRRLRDEGRRYSELVEGVRVDHAKRLLANGVHSVTEVADLMGYAGVDTFSRAFRRWTGQSPRSWQRHVVDLSPPAKSLSPPAKG